MALRPLCCLVLLAACAAAAQADVIRCTDAGGNVSYTDKACPSGARQTGNVPVPESAGPGYERSDRPAQEQLDSVNRARQLQRETVDSVARQQQATPQPPAGATIIDSRGGGPAGSGNAPASDPRYGDEGRGGVVADTWYPYGGGGYYRGAAPQRDMRPTIRNCDANGCNDTLGNHYNRKGQIDRYQSGDGRTCRQVNSTQVCR